MRHRPLAPATLVAAAVLGTSCADARAPVTAPDAAEAAERAAHLTLVRLASSNVCYEGGCAGGDPGPEIFQADVTVENLMGQSVATGDGTAADGIRVFFVSPPAATGGTGTVTVANADDTGSFTSTGQPYFQYGGTTGAAYCWGFNGAGGLGNGTTSTSSATPALVLGGHGFSSVHPGTGLVNSGHTCGIASDGTGWCWGDNAAGQLGDGDLGTDSPVPVQVAAPPGVTWKTR